MSYTLNLNKLIEQLAAQENSTYNPLLACSPYLLEHVIDPLTRNETVYLDSLDFAAFDEIDVDTMLQTAEILREKIQELGCLLHILINTKAKTVSTLYI